MIWLSLCMSEFMNYLSVDGNVASHTDASSVFYEWGLCFLILFTGHLHFLWTVGLDGTSPNYKNVKRLCIEGLSQYSQHASLPVLCMPLFWLCQTSPVVEWTPDSPDSAKVETNTRPIFPGAFNTVKPHPGLPYKLGGSALRLTCTQIMILKMMKNSSSSLEEEKVS